MKASFVKTENVQRLMAALTALEERGAGEARLMVVDGLPGLGKTAATAWMAARNDCVFARAGIGRRTGCSFGTTGSTRVSFRDAVSADDRGAGRAGGHGPQQWRDVRGRDRRGGLYQSIGQDAVDAAGFERFSGDPVHFGRHGQGADQPETVSASDEPGRSVCRVFATDVDGRDGHGRGPERGRGGAGPDRALIHRHSKGFVREVKEAIAHIERLGARHSGAEIGVAEMAGQVLLNDRATSKPIVARG